MDEADRARRIAQTIEHALKAASSDAIPPFSRQGNGLVVSTLSDEFTITGQGGCVACDPGACPVCGFLFTGAIYTIRHRVLGKRVLSDKTIHYLAHGITRYLTGYIVLGQPVEVVLDVNELERYLGLQPVPA